MASESINNIENNARKLSSSEIEDGKQMEVFNKAQNQLLNIQAERKNNIQQARLQLMSEEQNNRNISQLSEIMTQQSRPVVVRQPGINPHTQAILNKYGYGKTGTITTRSQSKQVTPQNIVINNNTENKTTNNVSVPPQSPAPIVQSQSSDNSGKFKAWLNNEFSRQKEQASIREREFNRREWSLSRSTSKLMDFMGDVGKSISENLNPKRIGSIFNTEMKSISFILGLQYLAVNWKKLLRNVNKIETWLKSTAKYFGIGEKGGVANSDFVKAVKVFLGGNTEQSLVDVFSGLFSSGIDLLMKRLELFFKLRGEAAKSIPFPKIDGKDLMGTIASLGKYLSDILTCLLSGKEGITKSVVSSIERMSSEKARGKEDSSRNNYLTSSDSHDDTSMGDLSSLVAKNKRQTWLEKSDLDVNGNLKLNEGSSLRQSLAIGAMLTDEGSEVHTAGILGGLNNLRKAVTKKNLPVSEDFFKTLGEKLGINLDEIRNKVKKKKYKIIREKKTEEDLSNEGSVGFTKGFAEGYGRRTAINSLKEATNTDNTGGYIADAAITGDIVQNATGQGIFSGIKGKIKEWSSDKYKYTLVPEDDPREGVEVDVTVGEGEYDRYTGLTKYKTEKRKSFELYELTPEVLDFIEKKLKEKLNYDNFSIGFDDPESIRKFNDLLISIKKAELEEKMKNTENIPNVHELYKHQYENLASDIDIDKHYKVLEEYDAKEKQYTEQYEQETKDNQFKKFQNNATNAFNNALNAVNEFFSGDAAANEEGDEGLGSDRNISSITRDEVSKINVPTELKKTSAMVGKRLVDYMKSFMGKLKYSQVGPRDPKEGSADCSSTVRHAMIDIAGIDPGTYTEAQITNPSGVMVDGGDVDLDGNGVGVPNESNLQPGDLMFFKSSKKNNRFYGVGHVEMYIGDGLMIGHGSGNGPKIHRVGKDFKNRYIMSKRFVDIAYPNSVEINNTSDQKDYVSDFYSFKNSLNSSQSTPYTFNYNYDSKQASFNKNYPSTSTTYSMPPIAENKNSAVFEDISNLNIGLKSQGDRLLLLADSIYTLTEAVSLKGNNYYVNNTSSVKTSSSMTSLNNNNSNILN